MLRIGLTGGIGCGKSTVAARFREQGAPIIDSDVIARELVEPGTPALAEIIEAFGGDIVDTEGHLKRATLRDRVFRDDEARGRLNAIVHPRVRNAIEDRASAMRAPYCIIVVPLLIESGMTDLVDRVLVVDCPRDIQLERLLAREGMTRPLADAMIASQATREERLQFADDIIDNRSDIDRLRQQVDALDRKYRALSDQVDT